MRRALSPFFLSLSLLGGSLLAACAGTVVAPAPPPRPELPVEAPPTAAAEIDLAADLAFDPDVVSGRFDNGLTYFIRENRTPEERADLWLVVNAGSMQEDDDQRGLAHFVEHMAFNGTENFEKQQLVDYLERIGMRFGPDVNAFTSFDETVYMLRFPTDDTATVDQAFQILEDWSHAVTFEDEEIDKERGVVVEEWRLGRGAQARLRDRQFPILFKDSRYAERLPIGEREILETAPYEAFHRFYRDWYRPDLMAVVAIGDFEAAEIEEQVRRHFADLEAPAEPRPRLVYEVPDHEETFYAIDSDPEMTATVVSIYHKLDKRPQHRVGDYRRQIAENLYHGMVNARLDEIRQRADPPFLFGFSGSAGLVRSRDIYLQAARVPDGGVLTGLAALLTEVERVDRHGFTQGELERAKTDLLRDYEQAYKERDTRESDAYAAEYMRHFLEGEPSPGIERELELVRALLPTFDLAELNRLADEWITESNRVVLVGGPQKEAAALPDEAALAAVFDAVQAADLEPWVDRVREEPLMADLPTPSPVVEEVAVAELGLTQWRLANGVLVVLKPTDFKNDEVLLTGFSPGGHSLVDDARYDSAVFASHVVSLGGVGAFSQVELEKALAGKVANADVYIDELQEGVNASAAPSDLETMLQLVHLRLTAPRRDDEAFQSFLAQLRAALANRNSRPEAVFADRLAETLFPGHPRRRPIDLETADRIDLDEAFDVYRERFADAGEFTFVLVGNLEPAAIRPLVETYLGGLPATGRGESWRDVGAEPDRDAEPLVVRKGLEPKSSVRLLWGGPAEWSRENVHAMSSLASALRIKLREVMREDMGAVYGVGVSGAVDKLPRQEFELGVRFGCAPENVERLIDSVVEAIRLARAGGLDESYAEKVRETQRRKRETDLRENEFWLGALSSYYWLDLDPRLLLDYEKLVAQVTPESLRATAERYLDPGDHFRAVLLPAADAGGS